ncbi:MAG TPA: CotH kinase family protein, partial [Planctomycetia bacterium]|nr:CotH kinase family protein [Planctomycetia bacterium]
KYFGLYSIVENVDDEFLADRGFPKDAGLFKPSTPDLFADLGDSWEAYDQAYDPKVKLRPAHERRVLEAVRELSSASEADFARRIGGFFDLDEAARFFAVTVWISDFDSILASGQNYYLALDPKSKKFRFIAWDKDHTFGSWAMKQQEEREQLSIRVPWEGKKPFLERLYKCEAFRKPYFAALADLNKRYPPETVKKMVAELAAAIRPAVKEEGADAAKRFDMVVEGKSLPAAFFGFGPPTPTILPFVKARTKSVADQLAGKSEGKKVVPFGAPGGQGAPPPPEEMVEKAIFKALDTDKDKRLTQAEFAGGFEKWFVSWDVPKRGAITEDQLRKGLNRALPFAFEPPPPPGGAKKGPGDPKKSPDGSPPAKSKSGK